jgi:hypothetical protein
VRRQNGSTTISALTTLTTPKNPLIPSSTTSSPSTAPKSLPLPATTQILKSVLIGKNVITPCTLILPNPAFQISQARNTNSGKTHPFCPPPLISPGGREVYSLPPFLPCNLICPITSGFADFRIDERYLNGSTPARAYRVETFRSNGSVSATSKKQIRAYFVSKCNFVNPNPSLEEMRDVRMCSDKTFLEKVTENTLDIYQSVVDAVLQRSGMSPIPFGHRCSGL